MPDLDADGIGRLLRRLNLFDEGAPFEARSLPGGISSSVWRAQVGDRTFVVKRPRATFKVADPWRVPLRRGEVERDFVQVVGPLLPPASVPGLVAYEPTTFTLVFDAVDEAHEPWKLRLLQGDADPELGRAAGRLLAAVHAAGERSELRGRFKNDDLFGAQRIDPYFRAAARRLPRYQERLARSAEMFFVRQDLVHGDFSPKNMLTDGTRLILIDHEVATRGDAAFDVAFFLTHVTLKSIHLPKAAARLQRLGDAFLDAYVKVRADPDVEARAMSFLGPLLLARVVGKSPAEYLTAAERERALLAAGRMLRTSPERWLAVRVLLT